MMDLLCLARDTDLPSKWDGHNVEWAGWDFIAVTICPPLKPEPCRACGSTAASIHNTGRADTGERFTGHLIALRCPSCRTDTVKDWNGDWWNLGPEDYTAAGSLFVDGRDWQAISAHRWESIIALPSPTSLTKDIR